MPPDSSSACPHCGLAQEALTGLGWMMVLRTTDVLPICRLLRGDYDDITCEDCNKPLGARATVSWFDEEVPVLHTVLGSRMDRGLPADWKPFADVAEMLSADLGQPVTLEKCASMEALRTQVRERLRARIDPLLQALASQDVQTVQDFAASADVRTFGAVEVGHLLPSSGLALVQHDEQGTAADTPTVYHAIAHLQVESWRQFQLRWLRNQPAEPTLGEGLSRHLRPHAVLPGADAAAFARIDERLKDPTLSERGRYLLEAMRAAIHATVQSDNPKADEWAHRYFTAGLQARLATEPGQQAVARALDVGADWASRTVTFDAAWNALAELFPKATPDAMDALKELSETAGHPGLMPQFTAHVQVVDQAPSADRLVDMVKTILAMAPPFAQDPSRIATTVELCGQTLEREGMLDEIEAAIDRLVDELPAGDETRARLLVWFGRCCKDQRRPKRFLKRIGDHAPAWEQALDAAVQIDLAVERSNALRLLGRYREALQELDRLEPLLPVLSAENHRVVRRNRAILLRETGDVEGSVAALEALLKTAVSGERIALLESLTIGYHALNRYADASRCADEMVALSRGPMAKNANRARALKALSLVLDHQDMEEKAVELLLELDQEEKLDAAALLPSASAWVTLLLNDSPALAASEAGDALGKCIDRLWHLVQVAHEHGDVFVLLSALRLSALMVQAVDEGEAERFWSLTLEACDRHQQPPGTHELLVLASLAYERGELVQGRRLLLRLPEAVVAASASALDVANVSSSLARSMQRWLERLGVAVSRHRSSFEDLRLVAEMRRDTVARAQRLANGELSTAEIEALSNGLSDTVLSRLAPLQGQVAVLEWLDTSEQLNALVTVIGSEGPPESHWLPVCPVDLDALARRMGNRLRDWTPERPGDPFDLDAWEQAERWLLQSLEPLLGEDAHLVFLEHHQHAGLPWHVAAGVRWSASYASGWGALLSMESRPTPPTQGLGLAMIPRWSEAAPVVDAMSACAGQVQALAAAQGLPMHALLGAEGDAPALAGLLASVDTALLICHGFVDTAGQEVALMVAHEGHLPSAWSVAVNSAAARAHRFGWRQCRALRNAPATVFSAACSSNRAHVVGLGDRIGLFAALRHAGTRRLVAPHWDVVATGFLPQLQRVLEQHLAHDVSLAQAVRQTCLQAQNHQPRWLCWALCIEGDWR